MTLNPRHPPRLEEHPGTVVEQAFSYSHIAIGVAVLAGVAWLLFLAPLRYSILSLVGDDAGYYFGIARNFCLGRGSTFDRIHATNGFNPLYTGLLILFYKIGLRDYSILGCYRIGVLVDYAAILLGLGFHVGLLRTFLPAERRWAGPRFFLLTSCVSFYVCFLCLKSYYGIDAPLVLLFGNLYLYRIARLGILAPGWRPVLVDGAALGLLFLARLDSLALVGTAYGMMAWLAIPDRARILATIKRAGVSLLVVAPYFIWSFAHFATWMPVSARLKSSFPHASLTRSLYVIQHTSLNGVDKAGFLAAWMVSMVAILWMVRAWRSGGRKAFLASGRRAVLGLLSVYLFLRIGFILVFSRLDVQGSYAILAHVYNILVLLSCIEHFARRHRPPAYLRPKRLVWGTGLLVSAAAIALLAGKARVTTAKLRASSHAASGPADELQLAQEVRKLTADSDVLFGGAFGLMGYFSDRAWINADGVANDYDYQRVLRDGGLAAYLKQCKVTHVVISQGEETAQPDGRIRLYYYSPLYDVNDSIYIRSGDILFRRSSLRTGGEIVVARYAP